MKFCPNCRNMLHNIEEDGTRAFIVCRKDDCKHKEEITSNNPIVYDHKLKSDTTAEFATNPYLKYDPTLTHLNTVVCPNDSCRSHGDRIESDVVAVQINSQKLIWMYQCVHCEHTWTQSSRKYDGVKTNAS